MAKAHSRMQAWPMLLTALAAGMLLTLLGMTAQAHAAAPVAPQQEDTAGRGREGREVYGRIETMPASGLIGQWTVDGSTYTTDANTEFDQSAGGFDVGVCVKLHLKADGVTVREMDSEPQSNCNSDDDGGGDQGHGELYAELVSFPPGLIGTWQIGTINMTADASTEFDQRHGSFKVGEFVKAEFGIQADGTFLAREIKTISNNRGDDDDDHGPGHGHGRDHDGKAFGVIDVDPPAGDIGIWQIGGISYNVTADTELNDHKGPLVAGQNVKVEYWTDDEGNRTAKEIKAMPEGAGGDKDLLKLVGYVQSMPSGGFVGNWTIGDVEFVADDTSRFEEEHGMLDVSAFVEVKYTMQDGARLIVKLETHVPPGGGDDDHMGRVERMDDSVLAATTGAAAATWTVGGRSYVVNDATDVGGSVAVGSNALVNSYTAADGTQVATRIASVTLDHMLYLPSAMK